MNMKRALRHLRGMLRNTSRSQSVDLSIRLQEPPLPPTDYEFRPPDFIGIGAQKCGTSWWQSLITSHPEVYDSSYLLGKVTPAYLRKERHFFDRFFNQEFEEKDANEYAKWFARPKGMICGEWTPRYLVEHWAPALVKTAVPSARLLVMVRDPVDRFVSGMRHTARRKSTLDGNDAHEHYLRGLYCRQINTWLSVFPRSQILLLQYEKCMVEPQRELRRTFDFLGLSAISTESFNFTNSSNPTRNQEAFSIDEKHRQSLVDSYRDDVEDLLHEFPEVDRRFWKHFDS